MGSQLKTFDRYEGLWAMGFPLRFSSSRQGSFDMWPTSEVYKTATVTIMSGLYPL